MNNNTQKSIKQKNRKNIYVITGVILVVLIAVFTTAAAYTATVTGGDRILDGVYADGVNLSGMTESDAQSALAANAAKMREVIDFVCDDVKFSVTAAQIGLEPDFEASAKQAYEYGRDGNAIERTKAVLGAKFGKKRFDIIYKCDENLLFAAIDDNIADKIVSVTPYSVEIGTDRLVVTNAVGGREPQTDGLVDKTTKYASHATDEPVEVVLHDVAASEIDFGEFCSRYLRSAADATYTEKDGGYVFTPEVRGISFDKAEAKKIIEENRANSKPYEIPAVITEPKVTVAQLEDMFVSKSISEYSTSYASSDANRASNVALAASKINGKVLNPGERFSFNGVVGPRTAATGFKIAHVYEGDRVVDGMGGGICQVSSTLYNAVVLADLKIISRKNHSMPVGYVPLGRDATVSYGTIDFVFENNKPHPIKISAVTNNRRLTVSVCGAASDKAEVDIITENAGYTPFATKEILDSGMKVGERKIVKNGTNGAIVNSYKVYKKNGVAVSKEFLAKSTYVAIAREVKVGTAPTAESAPVQNDTPQTPQTPQPPQTVPEQPADTDGGNDAPAPEPTETEKNESTEVEGGTE